jgi:hypothetical protein
MAARAMGKTDGTAAEFRRVRHGVRHRRCPPGDGHGAAVFLRHPRERRPRPAAPCPPTRYTRFVPPLKPRSGSHHSA